MKLSTDRARSLDEVMRDMKALYHKVEAQSRAARHDKDDRLAPVLEDISNGLLEALGKLMRKCEPEGQNPRARFKG